MAEPSRRPAPDGDTGEGAGVGSDRGSSAGTPRWVKAFAIVALVLVLLFVVLQVVGGGGHSPGRHAVVGGDLAHALRS